MNRAVKLLLLKMIALVRKRNFFERSNGKSGTDTRIQKHKVEKGAK